MAKAILPYTRQAVPVQEARQVQSLEPALSGALQSPGIDMRQTFNAFIEPYGQYVILQRLNLAIHCSHCWDEKLGEGDPQCPECLGTGYQSVLERHISRRTSSLSEHRTQLEVVSGPGVELIDELFWFFEWNANPQASDLIYETTWTDGQKLLVDHVLAAYRVRYSYPFRASGGRVEFWRASCESRPLDNQLVGQHLRRLASTQLQIPQDGIIRYGMALDGGNS